MSNRGNARVAVRAALTTDFAVDGRNRFWSLFTARSVSTLGTAIAPVALAFAVLDRPGSDVSDFGYVLAARAVTQVVFLLYSGVMSDRLSRVRQLVIADLVGFAAQLALAAVFLFDIGSLGLLVGLSALSGAAAALFFPPSRAIVPDVVPQSKLQTAAALLRLSRSITTIGGAALAGVLVVVFGPAVALAVDAVTYLASAIVVAVGLHGLRETVSNAADANFVRELRDGWTAFRSRTWVWKVVAQFAVVNLCFTPAITVLGVAIVRDRYGGAGDWSLILTAEAVGLVIGGLVAIRLRSRHPLRVAILATIGFLPPFVLLGIGAPVWSLLLVMFVNGICADVFEILWETTLLNHVPGTELARVGSYDALGSFVLGPVGLVLVGPAAAFFGIENTLLGAGALVLVATTLTLASPSVWNLPAATQQPITTR